MSRMLKKIAAVIMVAATVLTLASCAKQPTLSLQVDGIKNKQVVGIPRGIAGVSMVAEEDYAINVVPKGEGDYVINVMDYKGRVYPITLKYHNGQAEAVAPEGVSVSVTVK